MTTRREEYTLRLERDDDGRVQAIEIHAIDLEGAQRQVRLNGGRAAGVVAPLHDLLRGAGLRSQQWSSTRGVALDRHHGAHVELLLRAVKPLRRIDRINAIADGIAGMSVEESGYWHAQMHRRHGLRALRVLLDAEGRR